MQCGGCAQGDKAPQHNYNGSLQPKHIGFLNHKQHKHIRYRNHMKRGV